MPVFALSNVCIAGIAAAVPGERSAIRPIAGMTAADLAKVTANTGVKVRHLAPPAVCTSDLCAAAADRLLERLRWDRASIDLLIMVTQTPDYLLPATACVLHGRLNLPKSCAAFDINLGCSGYIYGLSVAAAHVQVGAAKRVLLLVGDTISKVTSVDDRSVGCLFGDAGSATALEQSAQTEPLNFVTGSDGGGASHLQIPAGMFRAPSNEETRSPRVREGGNVRSDEQLYMNGPEIFNFTIREVPGMIASVLRAARWDVAQIDGFVFHQANRYMLGYLTKRMGLPPDKVMLALENYGNTSSASIPLTICDQLKPRLTVAPARLVLGAFGVGFSWASAAIRLNRPWIEPVICLS